MPYLIVRRVVEGNTRFLHVEYGMREFMSTVEVWKPDFHRDLGKSQSKIWHSRVFFLSLLLIVLSLVANDHVGRRELITSIGLANIDVNPCDSDDFLIHERSVDPCLEYESVSLVFQQCQGAESNRGVRFRLRDDELLTKRMRNGSADVEGVRMLSGRIVANDLFQGVSFGYAW